MKNIVLLDGGTSLELLNRSENKTPRHWSAEYLMQEPDLVRAVHLDYIKAGARVITINSYSATYTRMAMVNAEEKVPELQRIACGLAKEARVAAGDLGVGVQIAGCLPPLNGTYRPDRVRGFEENLDEYRRLAELQAPYVDFFLCETMSTAQEARSAALAASEFGKPIWVGWSIQDQFPRLRSGETISAAHVALSDIRIAAVLVNCAPPESISLAMPELVATGTPTGGYANGFTAIPQLYLPGKTKEQLHTRKDLDPGSYADFAMRWVADGAAIVGGCCEVGPAHIARLHAELIAGGHRVTGPAEAGI